VDRIPVPTFEADMPRSSGAARSKSVRSRAAKARRRAASSSAASALAAAHRRNLATLRREVMWWIRELNKIPKSGVKSGTVDKLLGRNDGIFDALNLGVQMLLRLIDKEQQLYGLAGSFDPVPRLEGEGLDRRITAELDRIAADREASGRPEATRTDH
jgi:hypothetical protein